MHALCQGRLTLTSGTPVTTSDVFAQSGLYFTPFNGNLVALYDGTAWKLHVFTQRLLTLSITAGTNYDIFLYDNNGTLTLEQTAWTNDTTRATNLNTVDGVLVKLSDTTRRYLGTIRASATDQCEDSESKRFVYNYYNKQPRLLHAQEATNSWTYNSSTYRAANTNTTVGQTRVEIVLGVAEDVVEARVQTIAFAASSISCSVGVGISSTSVNSAKSSIGLTPTTLVCQYRGYPGIGYRYLQWLEACESTITFYGDNNRPTYMQAGLDAVVMG